MNLLYYTNEFNLLVVATKALLLVASAIGLTRWYIQMNGRLSNKKQKNLAFIFVVIAAFYLNLLFLDLLVQKLSYILIYPLIFTFTIFMSVVFLLMISAPQVDEKLFHFTQYTLGFGTLALSLWLLTGPLHQTISLYDMFLAGQLSWLGSLLIYYVITNLVIGLFVYFSFARTNRQRTNGLLAIGATVAMILFLVFFVPSVDHLDLFWILYLVFFYFVLIFDLITRPLQASVFIHSLPLFERADIIMAIYGQDGTIKFLSHGATKIMPILTELDDSIIRQADGALHVLEKDDATYHWSSHPLQSDYLITLENMTDFMQVLREKETEQAELERQQIAMGTQSAVERETERILYRLSLLGQVDSEISFARNSLHDLILRVEGPITREIIASVKVWSRYIKRRALVILTQEEVFSLSWISLISQELLDLALKRQYSVQFDPSIELNLTQLKLLQDYNLKLALALIGSSIDFQISLLNTSQGVSLGFVFASSDSAYWQEFVQDNFTHSVVTNDGYHVSARISLEV